MAANQSELAPEFLYHWLPSLEWSDAVYEAEKAVLEKIGEGIVDAVVDATSVIDDLEGKALDRIADWQTTQVYDSTATVMDTFYAYMNYFMEQGFTAEEALREASYGIDGWVITETSKVRQAFPDIMTDIILEVDAELQAQKSVGGGILGTITGFLTEPFKAIGEAVEFALEFLCERLVDLLAIPGQALMEAFIGFFFEEED